MQVIWFKFWYSNLIAITACVIRDISIVASLKSGWPLSRHSEQQFWDNFSSLTFPWLYHDNSLTVNIIPTRFKFTDISRFSRQVVTQWNGKIFNLILKPHMLNVDFLQTVTYIPTKYQ